MTMLRTTAVSLGLALLFHGGLSGAVRGEKTAYVGGTVTAITQGTQGILNVDDRKELVFTYDKGGVFKLSYEKITSMEFGQKVGRRVESTVALGVTTLGVGALPMLFSKKKKHYLTIGFVEADGSNGVIVLELSKGNVRTVLPIMEARTGKKVELEEGTAKQGKEKT